ncbi:MAG: N-acetylneuraminate synthase [Patescibacteria group bacterium]
MIKNHKILTIIPARGGSQRLPGKNIKTLAGKPLIAHAIGAALGSNFIDRVIVSTDDKEIAKISEEWGAEIPFIRPAELATNTAKTFQVILHALNLVEQKNDSKYDIVVLIQPTTPLIQTEDIDLAINRLIETKTNSCVSVCEISERPEWMYQLEKNKAKPLLKVHNINAQSQDLPEAYRLNGAIYVTRREVILEEGKLTDHSNLSAIVMPRERSVDIDEAIDFNIAEIMFEKLFENNISNFSLSDGIFIIAEVGVNHNGSLEIAKKMVDAALEAGANAVKFQTFNTELLVSLDAPKAEYQKDEFSNKTQFEMLKELELSEGEFRELKKYCDEKKIIFLSTPFDPRSADFLNELDVPAFKIGSGDLTNTQLLKQVAKFGKPIILSTGMSTIEEISSAVDIITKENKQLILLHCTSSYPASHDTVNLKAMKALKQKFGTLIGYSDHTIGLEASIAAAALGARVVEKHFTLDKKMIGPDHKASINPEELKELVKAIRNIEKAIGDGNKKLCESELNVRRVARKSIFANRDIKKSEKISDEMLVIKRPETGIKPEFFDKIIGMKAIKIIKKDEPLLWENLS